MDDRLFNLEKSINIFSDADNRTNKIKKSTQRPNMKT